MFVFVDYVHTYLHLFYSGGVVMSNRGYSGDASIKSRYMSAKMAGNAIKKRDGTIASKLVVDYEFPKYTNIRKNKITLSSKFKDKSTASLYKFLVNA